MTTPDPTPAERREWATSLLERATPGPWEAFRAGDTHWSINVVGYGFRHVVHRDTDAVLIAAAPDLAAAVRDLAEQVEFMQARGDEHLDAFVEAVAERDALREQYERLRVRTEGDPTSIYHEAAALREQVERLRTGLQAMPGKYQYRCAVEGHQAVSHDLIESCMWHGAECIDWYVQVDPEQIARALTEEPQPTPRSER